MNQILFNSSSICNVPFQKYDEDFTFIVNGKIFNTSRIVADLLSSKIVQFHFSDPTLNEYSFHTKNNGDFRKILDFIIFKKDDFQQEDIPYLIETFEILDNHSIQIKDNSDDTPTSLDSVFNQITLHERYNRYYSNRLEKDIEYISQHFYSLKDNHFQILKSLKLETIEMIFNNPNLKIKSEDQLISTINKMYSENNNFVALYEYVNFLNVTKDKMNEFLNTFSIFDITSEIWKSISIILKQSAIEHNDFFINNNHNNRYHYHNFDIKYEKEHQFKGIIHYLKMQNNNNLNNVIEISASSTCSQTYSPQNAIEYDDLSLYFESENLSDSWLCFDFKDKRIKLENYTIRSFNKRENQGHLKSWVIEASNDQNKKDWKIVDQHENSNLLNGESFVHTFSVQNENDEKYRYIRLRQTGPSWSGNKYLNINSIEFYGTVFF